MRGARRLWSLAVVMAMLLALAFALARAADQPSSAASPGSAAAPKLVLSLAGRVKHPLRFDVEALRKLPA